MKKNIINIMYGTESLDELLIKEMVRYLLSKINNNDSEINYEYE